MSDTYAAITAHATQCDIRLMCAALDVSPSGYYAAVARTTAAPTARDRAQARSRVVVRAMFLRCRKRYGAPRLVQELRDAGHIIAKKSVARILPEEGLAARRATPFVCTTDSAHDEPIAPNVLARRFAVGAFATTNPAWVGDMTYIPPRAGWLSLAVLLDLASRRVVGWAVGTTLETRLPLTALQRALAAREPAAGLIQHSDRGSPYASHDYRAVLRAHGIVQSMRRRGDCWDSNSSTVHCQRVA